MNHKYNSLIWLALVALGTSIGGSRGLAQSGSLTLQIGSAALPTVQLVNHADNWRYRKGVNEPPADWKIVPEAALDANWLTGPGGIGYGDGDDATVLNDMRNNYYSVYIRKSFEIAETVDANRRLELAVDYDDGFVAYLDGEEIGRSSNVPGIAGSIHPYNQGLPSDHSAAVEGGAVAVVDVGLVGNRLPAGTHVLAVQGINGTIDSSDVTLIADLRLTGGQDSAAGGQFFSLVQTNAVLLAGSCTWEGSERIAINGTPAEFDAASGFWSARKPLTPGANNLFIAALDASGAILASTNHWIIFETATTLASGNIASDTIWDGDDGIIRVTEDVIVTAGATLTISNGAVVLVSPTASIHCEANSAIEVAGSETDPIYFLPSDGNTHWEQLSAEGVNSRLTIQYAEIVAGQVKALADSVVTLEDTVLRNYHVAGELLVEAAAAQQLTLRRCHLRDYDQCRFAASPVLLEDCLIEEVSADATDFADSPDILVRGCTYRYGIGANTDAIDNGRNEGMIVENCLIHDFPDKGVSIADLSHGTVVRNSLIYNCGFGISVYAASNCVFEQNTLANNTSGLAAYVRSGRPGPGLATGTNNIIWGNTTNVHLASGGVFTAAYSDIEGTNWPGPGNLSLNPEFVDPVQFDFALQANSPLRYAGQGDADMGVLFPVGGIPSSPRGLTAHAVGTAPIQIGWEDTADNAAGFAVERSEDGNDWTFLASTEAAAISYTDDSAALGQLYFYRTRATNHAGVSRFSNVASAVRQIPMVIAGGVLSGDTIWSPVMGTVRVISPVTVPAGVTLTIEAGTLVELTNRAGIQAVAGGAISVAGTEANPVQFQGNRAASIWGGLSAIGDNASLMVRHADLNAWAVGATNNATMLLEDCYIHDYKNGNWAIGACQNAREVTVRRCHFKYYHETLWRFTRMLIEESLFEYADNSSSDALDFDGTLEGSVIRRCTFRHGPQTNTDAIDLGSGTEPMLVEDCLMYGFPNDKGVSIGESTYEITIRNCLMYGLDSGVAVKDSCTAIINNCTIVDSNYGFNNYNKANPASPTGGGHITNSWDNILWNNLEAVALQNSSTLISDHSDIAGSLWPGVGNLSEDPMFVNPSLRDYRLASDSPGRGTGRDGGDLGCRFPVGAPMAASHPSISSVVQNGAEVNIQFWADSERSYTLQHARALRAQDWETLATVPSPPLPKRMTVTHQPGNGNHFYRLTSP